MANGNTVTLVGNITRDPELRFTNTGQATASFGLAVNRRWQNRQTQEWEEATSFIDVVCWREMAENAAESLTRGARVLVTGRLEQRSWETPDGDKRSKVEVVADEIGPSIRWATAQVTKNERRGPSEGGGGRGGGGQQGGGQSGGGGQQGGGGQSGGGQQGGGQQGGGDGGGYGYSEEPF
ncbi:MAG: single-strand DNA-binding protein [Acidimicrobiaceae bacterium]|jgi:single-strand DNA-binding protein|nr:single-strand DNA-binding protein [Acidimicrobiaceae bacterium]